MYQGIYEIISNKKLTESIFEMVLEAEGSSDKLLISMHPVSL